MELHNEILIKETEITNLKNDIDLVRQNLEAVEAESKSNATVKLENLQSQNKKLIDKVESLTQKCNNLESDLLKVGKYKIEIQDLKQREDTLVKELSELKKAKEKVEIERNNLHKLFNDLKEGLASCEDNIKKLSEENLDLKETLTKERKDFENQILTIREEAKKGLLSLEPKIREQIENDHLKKVEQLKREFAVKVEGVSSNNNSTKEMQLQLFDKDDIINKYKTELDTLKNEFSKKVEEYCDLEKNHLELIEDSTKLRNTISNLEKEKSTLENYDEKIPRLEAHIATLQEELKDITDISEKKEKEIVYLSQENFNLQESLTKRSEKLRIYEEKYESIKLETSESKLLELKLQKLEEERKSLLDEFELERKMYNSMLENHSELKEKQEVITELQEILNKTRHEVVHINENLEKEKRRTCTYTTRNTI
ncbi:hypothetical protein NQ314_000334 [Rhamnusium bicolor]|uniref:A kinase anchor protein 9 n=1 Tax=Rhamnusium bicolor TaxID=1586634 RepID=A0AAV8ZUT2_9CUCU|nr:hypothetical protein NQ314_000334 [Rhamnusium bicolor]